MAPIFYQTLWEQIHTSRAFMFFCMSSKALLSFWYPCSVFFKSDCFFLISCCACFSLKAVSVQHPKISLTYLKKNMFNCFKILLEVREHMHMYINVQIFFLLHLCLLSFRFSYTDLIFSSWKIKKKHYFLLIKSKVVKFTSMNTNVTKVSPHFFSG